MTPAEILARYVATGAQAEAVVRATAESLDGDWQQLAEVAGDLSDLDAARLALAKMEALAPYRALIAAVVATWDAPGEVGPEVVRLGGAS